MSKPVPNKPLEKPVTPATTLNEAETAELQAARDEALRIRYGAAPEVGALLHRLKDITRGLATKNPEARADLLAWIVDVGGQVAADALDQRTGFLDDLRAAIRADASGLRVEDKIQLAYKMAVLRIKRDYLDRFERGEHCMEEMDSAWPTINDVVEAYQRMNPSAKYESTKTQVKRWVKATASRTVTKRQQAR